MSSRELVLFVHGISPDSNLATVAAAKNYEEYLQIQDPDRKQGISHAKEYQSLSDGVARYIADDDKKQAWESAKRCFAEWGWESEELETGHLGASHRLIDAQVNIAARELVAICQAYRFSFVPQGPIRNLSLLGLSDIFYYLSGDDNKSIKARIYQLVAGTIKHLLDDAGEISLTVIGHSAGSVIARDLVEHLFTDDPEDSKTLEELRQEYEALKERVEKYRERRIKKGIPKKKTALNQDNVDILKSRVRLREAKESGRVSLRRLITMGSPIAMLALRSDSMIRAFAYNGGGQISSEHYGNRNGEELTNKPYSINVWNKYDPISFPVEPVYGPEGAVKDFHTFVSWNPLKSHTNYWHSNKVRRLIAEMW